MAEGRLRVRVAAPATSGKANEELQRILAGLFGVRPAAVEVRRGARSRRKSVLNRGLTAPPPGVGAGA